MIAVVGPRASRGREGGRGMPPSWQYFSRLLKRQLDEFIFAPLGRAALEAVTPANQTFLGCRNGCHDLMMAPPAAAPAVELEGRLTGGRRLGPVVAVLGRACEKKQMNPSAHPWGENRGL